MTTLEWKQIIDRDIRQLVDSASLHCEETYNAGPPGDRTGQFLRDCKDPAIWLCLADDCEMQLCDYHKRLHQISEAHDGFCLLSDMNKTLSGIPRITKSS